MSDNKRYYWLKLKETFWNDAPILFMRSLPNGDTLVIIYLKLLGLSAQNDGYIAFEGNYGTIEDEIALILRENKVNGVYCGHGYRVTKKSLINYLEGGAA